MVGLSSSRVDSTGLYVAIVIVLAGGLGLGLGGAVLLARTPPGPPASPLTAGELERKRFRLEHDGANRAAITGGIAALAGTAMGSALPLAAVFLLAGTAFHLWWLESIEIGARDLVVRRAWRIRRIPIDAIEQLGARVRSKGGVAAAAAAVVRHGGRDRVICMFSRPGGRAVRVFGERLAQRGVSVDHTFTLALNERETSRLERGIVVGLRGAIAAFLMIVALLPALALDIAMSTR